LRKKKAFTFIKIELNNKSSRHCNAIEKTIPQENIFKKEKKKKRKMTSSPPRTIRGESLIMASNHSSSSSMSTTNNQNNHAPDTPTRSRVYDKEDESSNSNSNRSRINSRDITRTYSGLFGSPEGDMLNFELARNEHTDWLERGGFLLLGTYVGSICIFQLIVLAVLDSYDNSGAAAGSSGSIIPLHWSWTVTNAVHCLVTTIYLHWVKGSMFDEHGELAAMTLWEQLEGRSQILNVKRTLFIVPTVLCYAACHFSKYSYIVCFSNGFLWLIHMCSKLPMMNGYRIFGINQTTGIDDNYEYINNDNNNDRHVAARRRRRRGQQQQRGDKQD
jgi:hypothetical protein